MKAIDVFQIVDPVNYTLFLTEAKRQRKLYKALSVNFPSIYSLLMFTISWKHSPQGDKYWRDVAHKLGNIEIKNFNKLSYYI